VTNVLPPSPSPTAATARAAPAGVHGTITNPPPDVAQLASGTILHGQVLRQDTRGHILVRTDLGVLQVLSPAQIGAGSQVTLQLRTTGSQLHVTILQVEGPLGQAQAPAQAPAPVPAADHGGPGPAAPAQHAAAPPDVLVLGQSLEAVVQGAVGGGKTALPQESGPPPLDAGSRLQLHVLRVQVPGGPSAGLTSGAPQAPQPATGGGGFAPGAQLTGLVTGTTATGQPLLQTAAGVLKLNLPIAVPPGTRLLFELEAVTPALKAAADTGVPQPAALAYGWPALDEAVALLQQLDGVANQALLAGANLPRPESRLASTILFFLQALGRGDLSGWLSQPAAEALERAGRGDLLTRLGQDFAQLARLSDNAGPEWRFLPIPFFDGSHVQPLRLFLRSRRGRGGGEGAEEPTRFILDVELSRFGDLQLDGLVRERRFDLVLRSRKPLSDAMRQDIAVIFGHANELSGTRGQIAFQASQAWSFIALNQPRAEAAGLLV
jgi:hypothetical protein